MRIQPRKTMLCPGEACLVELTGFGQYNPMVGRNQKQDVASSFSAIYIKHGLVLTTGTAVLSLLQPNNNCINNLTLKKVLSTEYLDNSYFRSIHCMVTIHPQTKHTWNVDYIPPTRPSLRAASTTSASSQYESDGLQLNGRILGLWQYEEFAHALSRAFPGYAAWRFHDKDQPSQTRDDGGGRDTSNTRNTDSASSDNHDSDKLMSYFMFVQLGDGWEQPENELFLADPRNVKLGDMVTLQGCPFGNLSPGVFMNSLSEGVLSNMAGCLILTDARSMPGSEGGPLYLGKHTDRVLLGVVVSSLCWKGGEWVGLSVACALMPMLDAFSRSTFFEKIRDTLDHHTSKHAELGLNFIRPRLKAVKTTEVIQQSNVQIQNSETSVAHNIMSRFTREKERLNWSKVCETVAPYIVRVETGSSWGSGVLVTSCHVITCGHVVKHLKTTRVLVCGQWIDASVVYSRPDTVAYDIALLHLKRHRELPSHIPKLQISLDDPKPGCSVLAMGFGLFSRHQEIGMTVTRGILSSKVSRNKQPVLLHTSCLVQCGASGGGLLDRQGRLIGIIVCNARDGVSGCNYSHVSLCVPITVVWPILQRYIELGDTSVLDALETNTPEILNAWQLKSQGPVLVRQQAKL